MSEENKRKLGEQLVKVVLDKKTPSRVKIKKMDYLIRLGGDVNASQELGYSVLGVAKLLGKDDVVCFLEERGAVDNGIDKERAEKFFKNASVEEINKVLEIFPEGYVLDCDVDLSHKGLNELPDFSKFNIVGDFICSNNELVTLDGVPREVGGNFDCAGNLIFALRGAPIKVGGNFNCSDNMIFSLKGVTTEVNGNFDCSHNFIHEVEENLFEVGGKFVRVENEVTLQHCTNDTDELFVNECRENNGERIKGDKKVIERLFEIKCCRNEIALE